MEEGMNSIRMATHMLAISKMGKPMEKEYLCGQTVKYMMVNGKMD
jgi:hypothetical protein